MLQRLFRDRLTASARGWPLIGGCLITTIVSIWVVFAGIAYETHATAWRESEAFSRTAAELVEQRVEHDIAFYDRLLQGVAANVVDANIAALPQSLKRKALFGQPMAAPGLDTLFLVDRAGDVVLSYNGLGDAPRINIADRPYFMAQRDRIARQPVISDPLKSRVTQTDSIVLSRPVLDAKGAFDGLVGVTINVDYLNGLLRSLSLPDGSIVALVNGSGSMLARFPPIQRDVNNLARAETLMAAVRSGSTKPFVVRSKVDGAERLVAYRRVGSLPLYLAVGLPTEGFLGKWRWRLAIACLAFLALSAIIVGLGFTLARELARRAAAEETLSRLAATDSLTQIANRRRFDEVLNLEWRRAMRDGSALSLLMVDGDYFKAFNDTYGHVEGDQVLRLIADTLRNCVDRAADLVARFGGEEFVVLLPGTDRDGAQAIAQSIRRAILDQAVPHAGSPLGVLTVSIGVATRYPRVAETVSGLIEIADAALYIAKAEGRDRIVVDASDRFPPQAA